MIHRVGAGSSQASVGWISFGWGDLPDGLKRWALVRGKRQPWRLADAVALDEGPTFVAAGHAELIPPLVELGVPSDEAAELAEFLWDAT